MSRTEKRGTIALEAWAKQNTEGYDGVAVRNMTTSWRNGLAFCALIHRYRPDLIDYEKLDPSDILGNCALAFEVAETQLGIPALLDPEDMAACEVPDRLSVLTYVAQFYNAFKNKAKVARRSLAEEEEEESSGDSSVPSTPPKGIDSSSSSPVKELSKPSTLYILKNERERKSREPPTVSKPPSPVSPHKEPSALSQAPIMPEPEPVPVPKEPLSPPLTSPDSRSNSLKSTSEVLNIRQRAVLTVADQLLHSTFPAAAEVKEEPEEVKEEPEEVKEEPEEVKETEPQKAKVHFLTDMLSDAGDGASGPAAPPEHVPLPSEVSGVSVAMATAAGSPSPAPRKKKSAAPAPKAPNAPKRPAPVSHYPPQAGPRSSTKPSPAPSPRSSAKASPAPSPRTSAKPSPAPSPTPRTRSSTLETSEVWRKRNYYPAELNPFESVEDLAAVSAHVQPVPSNPFEEEEEPGKVPPKEHPPSPVASKKRSPSPAAPKERLPSPVAPKERSPSPLVPKERSPSPEAPKERSPSPAPAVPAPLPVTSSEASLPETEPDPTPPTTEPKPYNPFEDDEEDEDIGGHEDLGSISRVNLSGLDGDDEGGSVSSKRSSISNWSSCPVGTSRSVQTWMNESSETGLGVSESCGSVRAKSRKTRRAPLPPMAQLPTTPPRSPKSILKKPSQSPVLGTKVSPPSSTETTRKMIHAPPDLLSGIATPQTTNRTAYQQLKKKRRAPPPRRRVTPLPEESMQTEFSDLEVKVKELERQRLAMECSIRKLLEKDGNPQKVDEMTVQLTHIVKEKGDLVRRQTELEYLRRSHRLEEKQAELEFDLRVLLETPEDQRQDDHELVEKDLLDGLLDLVNERNEVVDWLDFHRIVEIQEDLRLTQSLSSFLSLGHEGSAKETNSKLPVLSMPATLPKVKGKKEKVKEKKSPKAGGGGSDSKLSFFGRKKKSVKEK